MCGRFATYSVAWKRPRSDSPFMRATAPLGPPLRPNQAITPAGNPRTGLPTVRHAADHADLPHPVLDLGRPVGKEAVLAVERLCTRVRVGHPQRRRLLRIDDRLQQRRPSTRAMVGRIHLEHIQLPRPRCPGVQGRA